MIKTASYLKQNQNTIARMIVSESGKAFKYALGEVKRAQETFTFAAEETKQIHGKTVPLDASMVGENRFALYLPFPLGVDVCL